MPGDRATARGVFGPGAYEGRVKRRAELRVPDPEREAPPKPGATPAYAIPLGQIVIHEATGHLCCWVARVEFAVPTVPRGLYQLNYCNDPCTVDGLGDLSPSSFFIIGVTDNEGSCSRGCKSSQVNLRGGSSTSAQLFRSCRSRLKRSRPSEQSGWRLRPGSKSFRRDSSTRG